MTLPITALTAAICAIMVLATAFATIRQRLRAGRSLGFREGDTALMQASRSHANLTEYAPIAIIMIGCLELAQVHHWGLTAVAVVFLASRASHIVGMHIERVPNAPRMVGMIGTFLTYIVLIGWILFQIVTVNA